MLDYVCDKPFGTLLGGSIESTNYGDGLRETMGITTNTNPSRWKMEYCEDKEKSHHVSQKNVPWCKLWFAYYANPSRWEMEYCIIFVLSWGASTSHQSWKS